MGTSLDQAVKRTLMQHQYDLQVHDPGFYLSRVAELPL